MLTYSCLDCRQGSEDPSRHQQVAVGRLVRGRMSSVKKGTPRSKARQKKQADKERCKRRREARSAAAAAASQMASEQVSFVPAPHARGLRCRIERK